MCRQYSISAKLEEIRSSFHVDEIVSSYRPSYNVIPTKSVPVVRMEQGRRVLDSFRWGMMPFWAPDAVNADYESVSENQAYYKIVERQRCIIPCSGLYYWRVMKKRNYPVHMVLRTNQVFGIAGLYEKWKSAQQQIYYSCTMVMTRANRMIAEFDSRMPAILDQEEADLWLEPETLETAYMLRLLKPAHEDRMRSYPVSPMIAEEHIDEAACIEEWNQRQVWVKA